MYAVSIDVGKMDRDGMRWGEMGGGGFVGWWMMDGGCRKDVERDV